MGWRRGHRCCPLLANGGVLLGPGGGFRGGLGVPWGVSSRMRGWGCAVGCGVPWGMWGVLWDVESDVGCPVGYGVP